MIKRILLATIQTIDNTRSPVLPAEATAFVCVAEFNNRMLVQITLPDGTAATANTIADIDLDADGRKTGITVQALGTTARNAIKTYLTNQGIDASAIDTTVNTRAKLLRFLLRRAGWAGEDADLDRSLDGYDAG